MSCYRPFFMPDVVDHNGRPVPIPCRTCECCRADITAQWKDRCKYEFGKFGVGAFVTFTYDDDNLYFSDGFGRPSLNYEHFHKFMDSIRHRIKHPTAKMKKQLVRSVPNFKYLAVGEYGDKFERPHYHCLFFGLDFSECKDFLRGSWKYGAIEVDPIKPGAFGYVIKYVQKQVFGQLRDELYFHKGVLPPKMFVSTGLGAGLYYDNQKDFLKYGCIKDGQRRINVPSYYAKKIGILTEDWIVSMDALRRKEEHRLYRHYVDLGGRLDISSWKIHNRQLREYKLRNVSFKRCGDAELFELSDKSVPISSLRSLVDARSSSTCFDAAFQIMEYGDVVPF